MEFAERLAGLPLRIVAAIDCTNTPAQPYNELLASRCAQLRARRPARSRMAPNVLPFR
jgi:hypothetical protein